MSVLLVALLSGVCTSEAAPLSDGISIAGVIVKRSCDVSLSTGTLQLGSFSVFEFTDASTEVGASSFSVSMTQCQGTLTPDGDALVLHVSQTGNANTADAATLWGDGGKTNAGILLKSQVGGFLAEDIRPQSVSQVVTPVSPDITVLSVPEGGHVDLSQTVIPPVFMTAGLLSPQGNVQPGLVKAVLSFDVAY